MAWLCKISYEFEFQRQVYFVYTELYKQSSFPKRAVELDFNLCAGQEIGKVVRDIFLLHLHSLDLWCQVTLKYN